MGRFGGNSCRLISMIGLTGLYFLVELIVGQIVSSVSLTADSFHMLSDVMALFVGLAAVRISRWPRSSKNTYGWQRAEVLGTLVNTVMLVTLCFTILVHAISRFFEPEAIKDPLLMIFVGVGGLVINVVGLLMFCGHGHHHGHSHLVDESQQGQLIANIESNEDNDDTSDHEGTLMNPPVTVSIENVAVTAGHGHSHEDIDETPAIAKQLKKSDHMNIKAVFLHILADALGSVIVMITALVLKFVPGNPNHPDYKWKLYLDPSLSVILVGVILYSAVPLLRRSGLILLQCVPKEVKVRELKKELEKVEGINRVHDLHIWQLQSNCFIGTVHLRCQDLNEYIRVSKSAKKVFHNFNIHCTTIQPEFAEHAEGETVGLNAGGLTPVPNGGGCVLDCGPREQCSKDLCCPTKAKNGNSHEDEQEHEHARPSPQTGRALDPEAPEPRPLPSEEGHQSETNLDE